MADLLLLNPQRALDVNGVFVPGAVLRFYISGSTTPATVFREDGVTPFDQPIYADANGIFPVVTAPAGQEVKATITTPAGVALPGSPIDPVPVSYGGLSGAANVSLSPSAGVPATNVQEAIDLLGLGGQYSVFVQTLLAAVNQAGAQSALGMPSNLAASVTLLTDWNNATTAGFWRGDASTANSPVGSAEHFGIAIPKDANNVIQVAFRTASDQVQYRRKVSGTWQSWRRVVDTSNVYSYSQATWGTAQTTTSGTAFDFTGIPSTAKEVFIFFDGTSLTGTDHFLVQIGAGSVVTTGYTGASSVVDGGSTLSVSSTSGFPIWGNNASAAARGLITLTLVDASANTWTINGGLSTLGAAVTSSAGLIDLGGTLDRVRITRTGSNTFDAGALNVGYR